MGVVKMLVTYTQPARQPASTSRLVLKRNRETGQIELVEKARLSSSSPPPERPQNQQIRSHGADAGRARVMIKLHKAAKQGRAPGTPKPIRLAKRAR
jgi:hypothetical protein